MLPLVPAAVVVVAAGERTLSVLLVSHAICFAVAMAVVVAVVDVVVDEVWWLLLLLLLLCSGYMLQLLLLDSSLTMVNAGGVLRSSFNGLQEDNTGLEAETTCGSSDRSSDAIEPAIRIKMDFS